jgi:sugar phosphate isomerase/epimerase
MLYTRREIGKLALAGVPLASALVKSETLIGAGKPDSKWAGVQVGMNVPYNFGNNMMSPDETLERCLQLGVSAVELRSQPVEQFLGVPVALIAPRGRGTPAPDPAAQKQAAEDLRKWRLGVPMSKVKEFRKKWNDAGVAIDIVKYEGILNYDDDVVDYAFELAKNLGAKGISCEIDVSKTKRLGQFADKHKMMVGYHGHTATGPAEWEEAFSYAKYNGANVDIGHFLSGNKTSPLPFIEKYHDRVTHIHVKDKTLQDKNVPFGTGDTPIKEVLQAIRDHKWDIDAIIEFEYPVPDGSDRMKEMAKALEYCKQVLTART